MDKTALITFMGYMTALTGKLLGLLLGSVFKNVSLRLQGAFMGFTAGIMISFVSFSILPEAFKLANLYLCIAGILSGVCICVIMDEKASKIAASRAGSTEANMLKTGLLIAAGIMMHNLPEGMAIGSISAISLDAGLKLCVIVLVHCIPETFAVSVPLNKGGLKFSKIAVLIFIMALPMGIGSFMGAYLTGISGNFVALNLSFAGGIMLYITCEEILPESKEIWNGKFSTLGALAGFILGIVLTAD